jgi:hypothetical protein
MSGNHSPAPWHVERRGTGRIVVVAANNLEVCLVFRSEFSTADAELIARAPAMKEALENAGKAS